MHSLRPMTYGRAGLVALLLSCSGPAAQAPAGNQAIPPAYLYVRWFGAKEWRNAFDRTTAQ